MRISKYKNIFSKDFQQNWTEKIFVIKKKVKDKTPWIHVIEDLKNE